MPVRYKKSELNADKRWSCKIWGKRWAW